MFECSDIADDPDGRLRDPRIDDRLLRCLPATDRLGAVLLVGVVHDHPASIFRATRLLEVISPDVLAVELPPLAVPLFRLYGRDRRVPPRLGGEMSAAIAAVDSVPTVGIDAPNSAYLRSVVRRLIADRAALDATPTVLRKLVTGFTHSLVSRLGASLGAITPLRLRLYSPIEYDCSLLDPPAVQATHEIEHLEQRRAFLRAIEAPRATELIDAARETGMVERLAELRSRGDVVAIIGAEHLDDIYEGLTEV